MDDHPLGHARVEWDEIRTALAGVAQRLCELLRSDLDPTRPACGQWNVGDVAAHLSHAWAAIPAMAAGDLDRLRASVPTVPGVSIGRPSGAMISNPGELAAVTNGMVENDPERNLGLLADRIETSAKEFCEQFDPNVPAGPRPWMIEGIIGGPTLFAGHLLNETLVHGFDLANATGARWQMSDHEGAMVFRGFLLNVMVERTALMTARVPGSTGPEMTIDLRLAGDRRLLLRNTAAGMRVDKPGGGTAADARMWARPGALTLLAWKRLPLGVVLRSGRLAVWGRRPWMAKQLLDLGPKV